MSNLRDKTDRALRAFIRPFVDAVPGSTIPIYISNDPNERKVVDQNTNATGLIDVNTVQGAESPVGSGGYMFSTGIRVKYPAANQPAQENLAQQNANRTQLGLIISAIHDCLHRSDNGQDYHYTARAITTAANALAVDTGEGPEATQSATDNADMVKFSCLDIMPGIPSGGKEEGDDLNFIELLRFNVLVVGFNGYWE